MGESIFAVIRSPGPVWAEGLPMRDQAGWKAHAAYLNQLTSSGFILLGGPLTDSDEILLVVAARDEGHARDVLADDPWEDAGILITRGVRPWTVLLDSRAP